MVKEAKAIKTQLKEIGAAGIRRVMYILQLEYFKLQTGCLLLDGITAYTVNHQELVDPTVNLVLHGLFLISIDGLIFLMLLYMLEAMEGLPSGWKMKRFWRHFFWLMS
ncbi:MAG: hypothetical protein ACI4EO_02820 [Blautia sp.]